MGRRRTSGGHTAVRPLAAGRSGSEPHWAERLAATHLRAAGWRVLSRNYRLRGGEIDLVCEDPEGVVVFVEVKQRRSDSFGGPAAALDPRQRQRLRRTATHYLAAYLGRPEAAARFDAVLISGSPTRHHLQHLRDAW